MEKLQFVFKWIKEKCGSHIISSLHDIITLFHHGGIPKCIRLNFSQCLSMYSILRRHEDDGLP